MSFIDLQNRKPIYEQIVERFQLLIANGVLKPDSQMPSVRALAVELSINPNTIQKAYSILEQSGYIYPVKGRGNFVSGNKELRTQKQEAVFLELKELVKRGKELEISQEQFVRKIEEYYDGNPGKEPGQKLAGEPAEKAADPEKEGTGGPETDGKKTADGSAKTADGGPERKEEIKTEKQEEERRT